jgi:hypothetical protein
MGFERVGTKSQIGEVTSRLAPENSNRIPIPVGYHAQARWTSTLTSRLLLEAGFATQRSKWMRQQYEWNRGAKSSYLKLSNSRQTGAWWITGQQPEVSYNAKASMSYVTGSHNLKVGFENRWANLGLDQQLIAGDIRQYYFIDAGSARYRACQPGQVPTVTCSFPVGAYVLATPLGNFGAQVDHDLGIYAQDVWTIGRWTLNLGLRADIFRSSVPPQQAPAGNWVPARSFPEYVGGDFKDLVPRNDPRLEENAGRQVTLYTLNPAAYGRLDRVLRTGPNTDRTYNGVEFTSTDGSAGEGSYSGSVNYELTNDFSCDNPNPNSLQWCDYEKRLRGIDSWDTQFKAYGSYPLPWGIQASGFLRGTADRRRQPAGR